MSTYNPSYPKTTMDIFNATDGMLHSCPKKPLGSKTKKLIQEAVERMSNSNTHTANISSLLSNIDAIIEKLNGLKQDVI
ncbi:MAG TPA: hypothetical protein VE130_07885 [Nitrososphaeraceae archaeon]|nr:hypothetical protein [Nitrososphaeraceae archaeon]